MLRPMGQINMHSAILMHSDALNVAPANTVQCGSQKQIIGTVVSRIALKTRPI